MLNIALEKLEYLCAEMPGLLAVIADNVFSEKPVSGAWSKKEILGHLIDSATNNHQRFVRCQFETNPVIVYDQNKWNQFNFYQKNDGSQLVNLWKYYNLHLIDVVKNIPLQNLQRCCMVDGQLLPLDNLMIDYVKHTEHHLHQIVIFSCSYLNKAVIYSLKINLTT